MTTAKKLTIVLQKSLAEKLAALPKIAPQELNKKDFIAGLRVQIKHAESQGYTLEQIASVLKTDGVEISIPTLRTYLQQAKPASAKKAAKAVTASPSAPVAPAA